MIQRFDSREEANEWAEKAEYLPVAIIGLGNDTYAVWSPDVMMGDNIDRAYMTLGEVVYERLYDDFSGLDLDELDVDVYISAIPGR